MLDLQTEWSISFAGCGFMGIYYVGACSCILERFPRIIQDALNISGASAGALMGAALAAGVPLDKCCADLMLMAKEGRKHRLGPLHPSYNVLQIVQESLQRSLPEDAHVRVSGKLCVSLTRVSDGKNVLVSQFASREELIEALVCSCFIPLYCGVIPPTYRGVHYVDGAVSDNLPQCHLRNTLTFSAYAGESDLSPRASALNFHEVRFNNVSIQVNLENMYRVTSTFFPPQPEAMAEICQNGYIDALRFLRENNLISTECPLRMLETDPPKPACCELKAPTEAEKFSEAHGEEHWWLDPQLIDELPVNIRKALCEACRETHAAGGLLSRMTQYLPEKVISYLQTPCTLPVDSASLLAQRLVDWIPDVPRDMSWLYDVAGDLYRQAWKDTDSELSQLPSGLNLSDQREEEMFPSTPGASPTSCPTLPWTTHGELNHMPLTPPQTPTTSPKSEFGEATTESPRSTAAGWGLGRAVGWIRNIASKQTSSLSETDD